nr:hypothetical protein CFP56_00607 [Quercus suber]
MDKPGQKSRGFGSKKGEKGRHVSFSFALHFLYDHGHGIGGRAAGGGGGGAMALERGKPEELWVAEKVKHSAPDAELVGPKKKRPEYLRFIGKLAVLPSRLLSQHPPPHPTWRDLSSSTSRVCSLQFGLNRRVEIGSAIASVLWKVKLDQNAISYRPVPILLMRHTRASPSEASITSLDGAAHSTKGQCRVMRINQVGCGRKCYMSRLKAVQAHMDIQLKL